MNDLEVKKLLKDLGINQPGVWTTSSTYLIELESDTDWGKVESKLDGGVASGLLDDVVDQSFVDLDGAHSVYTYEDKIELRLTAEFDAEAYALEVAVL